MNFYLIIIIVLSLLLSYSFFVCSHLNHKNLELRIKLAKIRACLDCFRDRNGVETIKEIKRILEEKTK